MTESTTPLVPKTVLEGCCQHVTGHTGSNEYSRSEDHKHPAAFRSHRPVSTEPVPGFPPPAATWGSEQELLCPEEGVALVPAMDAGDSDTEKTLNTTVLAK